ncbi:UDP-glucose 4-epimerase GalE [Streptodolium elevatio]|uniref:UDP-glucose 4-epimerase n=1 Tax=Streptodolium elevatio TaxID=3157996 RepID=A0ABV3D802_9ACTN
MSWLVTGGAGYIGAHVVRSLQSAGFGVVVLDDLSTGSADRVPGGVPLVVGSVLDRALLDTVLATHGVDGVVHVAGKKRVDESVARPLFYYEENVEGLRTLLDAVVAAGVRRFVFSSSAAVYGMPDVDLVDEDVTCRPINPYGESKLVGEWLIRAAATAHGIAYASLRYFNVAGAGAPELADTGVFNLIPMVFERLRGGAAPVIFGDDYPTPDGTCVRDFIHVQDLAEAHAAAARRLLADPEAALTLNVGRGEGTSVRAMVDLIRAETGHEDVVAVVRPRRPGDPARVVAAADRIRRELGFEARYGLHDMVASAWHGWAPQPVT